MIRKTYDNFTRGVQENAQSPNGGMWSGSHLNFEYLTGAISPSNKPEDAYSNITKNYPILDMVGYGGDATFDAYALLDYTTSGDIFARTAATGVWATDNTITEVPVGGMCVFNSNMYWATTTKIGRYVGATTTYTDDAHALKVTQTTGAYIPMLVFGAKMYIGNMRYVASLDTTGTLDDDALILPAGYRIIDMRVWNDSIVILAQRSGSAVETKVFFWSTADATYEDTAQLNEAKPMAMFSYLGALLIFGLNGNIYQYRGTSADGVQDFTIVRQVPGEIEIYNPSAILMHKGEVLFGVKGASSNAIGVWALSKPAGSDVVTVYPKYTPKGDFKYDDGVSDYYSVTSLYNCRRSDNYYNPYFNSIEADTLTNNTAAGTVGWLRTPTQVDGTEKYWYDLASSSDGVKLVACVYGGKIYTSDDSGATWTARDSNRNWNSVASSEDGVNLVAAVSGGNLYTSADSGATWTERDSDRVWRSVDSDSDGSHLIACVTSGYVYISIDSGVSWTAKLTEEKWMDVACDDDGSVMYAVGTGEGVGTGDTIYLSTDSGSTWAAAGDSPTKIWQCVDCSDDGAIAMVGTRAETEGPYKTTNTGTNWTEITTTSLTSNEHHISCSDDGAVWALGQYIDSNGSARLVTSSDSGVTWTYRRVYIDGYADTGAGMWRGVTVSDDGAAIYGICRRFKQSENVCEATTESKIYTLSPSQAALEADDADYIITGAVVGADKVSNYLELTDWDLAVSTGNTITGIEVIIRMKAEYGTTATDTYVKLIKAGAHVGEDKGSDTDITTEANYTYGSAADLWGTTWTDAEVNADAFGVAIQATCSTGNLAIESVRVKVYYPGGVALQKEFLYAALSSGNDTLISETMLSGIVDLNGDGYSPCNVITASDDFELPEAKKIIRGIEFKTAKSLVGTEKITVYYNIDDSTNQELRNISWTEMTEFEAGDDDKPKMVTPFTCNTIKWKILTTPNAGTPTTPPSWVSYSVLYEPVGPFLETYNTK